MDQEPSSLAPTQYWGISYSVTRILAEAGEPNRGIDSVLQLLGTQLDWDVGAFWVVDDHSVVLRCNSFWNPHAPKDFVNFEKISRARQFSIDEGLPGAAWKRREPVWIDDVRESANFPRASVAKMDGLCTGFSFPVYAGKRVLGVMEFLGREQRACPPLLVDFLRALGGQIGIFLDRAHATDTLQQVEAQFLMTADRSFDVIFTINRVFGYHVQELIGQQLTLVMPEYLCHLHTHAVARYVETGKRHISWDGVPLPGLHKDGREVPLEISFGEFFRTGRRIFTGFVRQRAASESISSP